MPCNLDTKALRHASKLVVELLRWSVTVRMHIRAITEFQNGLLHAWLRFLFVV